MVTAAVVSPLSGWLLQRDSILHDTIKSTVVATGLWRKEGEDFVSIYNQEVDHDIWSIRACRGKSRHQAECED